MLTVLDSGGRPLQGSESFSLHRKHQSVVDHLSFNLLKTNDDTIHDETQIDMSCWVHARWKSLMRRDRQNSVHVEGDSDRRRLSCVESSKRSTCSWHW
jgi:hypothetical protein